MSDEKFGYIKSTDNFELKFQSCLLIDIEKNSKSQATEYHSNPICHCHYVLRGSCEFGFSDGTVVTVNKNQFIIIPRGEKHCILSESSNFSKIRIVFDFDVKKDIEGAFYKKFEKSLQKTKVYNSAGNIKFILDTLIRNNDEKKLDYQSLGEAYSYALVLETAAIVAESDKNIADAHKNDIRVEEAINYIIKNVSNPLSVTDVAKYVSISEKQLTRLFTECKNYTPAEYIRFAKFNLAVKLLLDTNLAIGEIAEKTGFNSISGFVNFFVRMQKVTPTDYRKKMRIFKNIRKKDIDGGVKN